jgi:hypothetical protein
MIQRVKQRAHLGRHTGGGEAIGGVRGAMATVNGMRGSAAWIASFLFSLLIGVTADKIGQRRRRRSLSARATTQEPAAFSDLRQRG